MDYLQIIILALIQGITEFLPISSSGHLILFSDLYGRQQQDVNFDISVHLGTLLAACFYFKNDLKKIVQSAFPSKRSDYGANLIINLFVAVTPALIVGFFIKDFVDLFLRNIEVIASATIFFAFILYISTRFNSSKNDISLITYKQSFVIGLAQCLALIPGTSRSGITISAGLMLGMDNKTASKFSFLLAVPTIGAIACYQFLSLDLSSFLATFKQNLIGALISFIVAYFTIDFFIKFIDRIGFIPFIIYRIILGLGLFFLIL